MEAPGFEAEEDPAAFAAAREALLAAGAADADVFVDLMVHYWQTTDGGFAATQGLDQRSIAVAGERLSAMLAQPSGWVSETADYRFWSRYIRWADFGGAFEIEDCIDLLEQSPDYREPVFFVYAASAGRRFGDEAAALWKRLQADSTLRAKYVRSVVQSVRLVGPLR